MKANCGKPVGWPYPDSCNMFAGHDGPCHVLGPDGRIVRADATSSPDEPAPREVDVAALRDWLARWQEDAKEMRGAGRPCGPLERCLEDAEALLDAERREPPGLPALPDREWVHALVARMEDLSREELEGEIYERLYQLDRLAARKTGA